MVQVFAQLIGGARIPVELQSGNLSVGALMEDVAHAVGRPPTSFKLLLGGKALPQMDSWPVSLHRGDVLVVVPLRQGVAKSLVRAAIDAKRGAARPGHEYDDDDDDDDDEGPTQLPSDAPIWEVKLVAALKRSGLPPTALEWLVLIRPARVLMLLLFMAGCLVASRLHVGPPFILVTIIVFIFKNLGRRRDGEASAYSIFNAGVRRLPGQLDADEVDRQLRRGQFM